MKKMATITEDFVTIANIIQQEIHRRREKRKSKENSKDVEKNTSSLMKFEKKMKKKKKKPKLSIRNGIASTYPSDNKGEWNKSTQLTTISPNKKQSTKICDDSEKYLSIDKTGASNSNKNELKNYIPIVNASEGEEKLTVLKKKKKKKNCEKKKELNNKATLKTENLYHETCEDNDKYLNKDKTRASNLYKNELTSRIPIVIDASEDDKGITLFKKKKKKKIKRENKEVQNNNNLENDKATLKTEINYLSQSNEDSTSTSFCMNVHKKKDQKAVKHKAVSSINTMIGTVNDEVYTTKLKKLIKKKKKKINQKIQLAKNLGSENNAVHTTEEVYGKIDERSEMISDFDEPPEKTHTYSVATSIDINCVNVMLKNQSKKTKKKKKKSKMETKEDNELSKDEVRQNKPKKIEYLKKNLPEDHSKKIHNNTTMNNNHNSSISKVNEEYSKLSYKLSKKKKKEQKKCVKVVTCAEVMSPKKSNKRKRQTIDKEYSKNNSRQSNEMDVEIYDSYNYIDEDSGKNSENFAARYDHKSEYHTVTDTDLYFSLYSNVEFNNDIGLSCHKNVYSGKTPLVCNVCLKMFTSKSKLCIHKRTHTGEKPYACNVCGRTFSHKSTLVEHDRTHTGEKPYACNVCGRSFSLKRTLVDHNRTHTGEKPHACNVCGRSFSIKRTLVDHNRTHTGEKPYACNVCGRSFSRQYTLVKHNRIHTGERPYECGQCEKKFSSSDACKRHTRNIHMKCF